MGSYQFDIVKLSYALVTAGSVLFFLSFILREVVNHWKRREKAE